MAPNSVNPDQSNPQYGQSLTGPGSKIIPALMVGDDIAFAGIAMGSSWIWGKIVGNRPGRMKNVVDRVLRSDFRAGHSYAPRENKSKAFLDRYYSNKYPDWSNPEYGQESFPEGRNILPLLAASDDIAAALVVLGLGSLGKRVGKITGNVPGRMKSVIERALKSDFRSGHSYAPRTNLSQRSVLDPREYLFDPSQVFTRLEKIRSKGQLIDRWRSEKLVPRGVDAVRILGQWNINGRKVSLLGFPGRTANWGAGSLKQLFYQSQYGTGGKTAGDWFAFAGWIDKPWAEHGMPKHWFVKGTSSDVESRFGSQIFQAAARHLKTVPWEAGENVVDLDLMQSYAVRMKTLESSAAARGHVSMPHLPSSPPIQGLVNKVLHGNKIMHNIKSATKKAAVMWKILGRM